MDKLVNKIKDTFTIQDLEILTGIKAHTIRIWEKRYELLSPTRVNRNVRTYAITDLQKILNVSLLYKSGYKISKISKLSDNQIADETKAVALSDFSNTYEINSLIICMYTFDQNLFHEIYDQQSEKITFREIFTNTYIPLLTHLGLLWQTDSIKPAHEHFVSNLIYQKIALNIAKIPVNKKSNNPINVLFLPYGEIHELGLLFLNYYFKLVGEEVIYLGKSIPFDNLFYLNSQIKNITWITYFMIDKTEIKEFVYDAEPASRIRTALGELDTVVYASHRPGSDRITRIWLAPALGFTPVQAERRRGSKLEWSMQIRSLRR